MVSSCSGAVRELEKGIPLCPPVRIVSIALHKFVTFVAVYLSGKAVVSINVIALRRARLVLGWITVCRRVSHPAENVTSHRDQLSLAVPSCVVGTMSIGESLGVNRPTARCRSPVVL